MLVVHLRYATCVLLLLKRLNSAKRKTFLEKFFGNVTSITKVKNLCRTRWIYRHEAYENFSILYTCLADVIEAICDNDVSYGEMNWDKNTIVAANGLLKMFHSFSFIVSFIVTRNAMSIINSISVKLQSYYDIVKAYNKVDDVIIELRAVRENQSILHSWYAQAESLAGAVSVLAPMCST